MNTKDLSLSERLETALEGQLVTLSAIWGPSPQTTAEIAEIRNAAKINFLSRTKTNLLRMANGSPYSEHQDFFAKLKSPDYQPRLMGLEIDTKSPKHSQALSFLKKFASYVGETIEREMAEKAITRDNPAWVQTGLIPTDNIVEDRLDWGRSTIPSVTVIDEDFDFREQRRGIRQIVEGASPEDLKNYVEQRLKPRLKEIERELEERRVTFRDDISFMIMNAPMAEHRDKLVALIERAEQRIDPPTPVLVATITEDTITTPSIPTEITMKHTESPFPVLTDEVIQHDAALEQRANTQLKALEDRIAKAISNQSGDALETLIREKFVPKLAQLRAEIEDLSASGKNPQMAEIKQRHLSIIQNGIDQTSQKIADENQRTIADARLETLQTRIAKNISIGTAEQLTVYYRDHLLPKQAALENEVLEMQANGADQGSALYAKQRHLDVIKAGISATADKLSELRQNAAAAKAATVPIQQPANDLLPIVSKNNPPVLTDVVNIVKPVATSRDVSNAETVPFEETTGKKPAKSSFMSKVKTALIVSAAGLVGAVAGFIWVAGNGGQKAPDTNASPAASHVFNSASGKITPAPSEVTATAETQAQPVYFFEAPLATQKDIEKASQPASPVDATTTPRVAKAEVTKVQKTVKADTVPVSAAANANVDRPVIATSFDIAASRIDLETWNKACNYLKTQNLTVENGICPK